MLARSGKSPPHANHSCSLARVQTALSCLWAGPPGQLSRKDVVVMHAWLRKLRHSLQPADFGAAHDATAFAPAAPAPQLFNDQQFRAYARRLAAAHPVVAARADDDLTQHLEDYEEALDRAFAAARLAATSGSVVEPAVE